MTLAARNLDLYFSGTVEDKLMAARRLFAEQGSKLRQQQDIVDGLTRMRQSEIALNGQMQTMAMGNRCSTCAAQPSGGCCSSFMAGNTDAILLLINLLMEIPVEFQHSNAVECCFLGSRGCILLIKPIFCLNYNCSHIKNAASRLQMQQLEKRAAALLSKQTALETLILEQL